MNDSIKFLACIHCNYEFQLNEVFVAYINENGMIIIAACIDKDHPISEKEERPGTGWIALKRLYDSYEIVGPKKP